MQSKKDLYQIGEVARLFHLSISCCAITTKRDW